MKRVFLILILTFFTILLFPQETAAFEYILQIPSGIKDFPIKHPTDGNKYCYGEDLNKQWEILQWKNSTYSLCSGSTSSNGCLGADFVRETQTMRICYWENGKRFELKNNTEPQPYNGCQPGGGGGYNLFVSQQPPNVYSPSWPFLKDIAKVNISAKIENKEFQRYGSCPSGQTWTEAAFSFMGVIVTNFTSGSPNYAHSIFYQVASYDNRGINAARYAECNFTKDWSLFADPVTDYPGQEWAGDGAGEKTYQIDVLPRIKAILKQCRPSANLDEYKVGNLYIGNELSGRTKLKTILTSPKLELVSKSTIECGLTVNGLGNPKVENGMRVYEITSNKEIANALKVEGTKDGVSSNLKLQFWRSPINQCAQQVKGCWHGQDPRWIADCCNKEYTKIETFFTNKSADNVTSLPTGIRTTDLNNVPPGRYYVTCLAKDVASGAMCTGNPFPGAIQPPWQDCGPNSRIIIEVKAGETSPPPTPTPTPTPSFSLSPGWNEITWLNISGYTAKTALKDIDKDCGAGTGLVMARKRKDWFENFVKEFGGSSFNLQNNQNYFINVSKSCNWNL